MTSPTGLAQIRGRAVETEAIERQLRVLEQGRGSITVVEGSPGAGKTRLLAEAAAIAAGLGIRVGAGGATRGDRVVLMSALLDAVVGGSDPLLPPDAFRDVRAMPDLRYWLIQEIEAELERAAARGPLLVSVDDLQWADGGTIAALEGLTARLAGLPIAWLVAWRPAEIPPEVNDALRRLEAAGAIRLPVGPLAPPAVAELVGDLAGAAPDDALLTMAASAQGTPFWLTELLLGLREEGLLETRDGRATATASHLPGRMRDTVQQRLDRMSTAARNVASVGAALGRRFTFTALAEMTGALPAALLEPVDELIRFDVLVDQEDALAFRHDILREAVLDGMPASARSALERQAAFVLLALGAPSVEVAEQLAASAQPGDSEAVDILFAAAKSLGGSDPGAAAELARRALEIAPRDDPRRGPLSSEIVLLLHASGQLEAATSFAETVLAGLLPPDQESQVQFALAGMFSLSPDVRAAAGRRALELPGLAREDRDRHHARLVHNVLAGGRRTEAQRLVADVADDVTAHGDGATVFSLGLAMGGLRYEEGDFTEALERIEGAVRAGSVEGEDARARIAQQWRTEVLATVDRFDEAVALAIDGLEAARRDSQAWAIHLWEQWRGRQHFQLGEHLDAIAALEGMLRPEEGHSTFGSNDASAISALSGTALHVGDRQLIRDCGALAEVMLERGTPELRRHSAWILAQQALAADDAARGRQILRDLAVGLPTNEPVLPYFPVDVTDQIQLVRLARAAGDEQLAEEAVALAEERAARNPRISTVVGSAAHARGLHTGDRAALDAAVAHFERSPRKPALASALEDAGVTALRDGARDEAVDAFDRALRLAVAMGATWDATRIRRRLRDLGIRRRLVAVDRPTSGWASLTESELAVVRSITGGMTNREAAAHLFLSPHTVSTHMRHVFEKLGINSRVELARITAGHD